MYIEDMKNTTQYKFFLSVCLICSIAIFSCRKKDERYEGRYVGTERHTVSDSGTTTFSLDTTYSQEVEVTYDKNMYTFLYLPSNSGTDIYTLEEELIVDGNYEGILKFSGDSMYLTMSNGSDYLEVSDRKIWAFKGKRN